MILKPGQAARAHKALRPFIFGAAIGVILGQVLSFNPKVALIVIAIDALLYLLFFFVLVKLDKRTY